jgi:NitT/TauT family transport system substrate-binding protein
MLKDLWSKLGPVLKVIVIVAGIAIVVVIFKAVLPKTQKAENSPTPIGNQNAPFAVELTRPLRVGIVTWGGYAGGILANKGFKSSEESEFFTKYGLKVEMVVIDDFPASRDAFKAGGDKGGVDVLWSTVDAFALEYSGLKAMRPVAFLQYDWSYGGDAIAVGPGIEKANDLKGKKICVAEDTPSHFFLLYVLAKAGLKPSDVQFVFTSGSPDSANLFKAGKCDATVAWSPDPQNAVKVVQGSKILMSTKTANRIIADIFITSGDFASKYPNTLRAFSAGWLKGVADANGNPDPAIDLMAKNFKDTSREVAAGMFSDVELPNYSDNRQFFEVDGVSDFGYDYLFKTASETWFKLGKIKEKADPLDTRMNSFIREVVSEFPNWKNELTKPPVPPGKCTTNPAALISMVNINFETNRFEITPALASAIKEFADTVHDFGGACIRVTGHTDDVGNPARNRILSQRRAESVVNEVETRYNIPAARFIEIIGMGSDVPVSPTPRECQRSMTTPACRALQRRTEIQVIPPSD